MEKTKPTLVVLAAGMGSRYGGLKQVDAVGPSGEAILDYSVFDALRAGFGKVVFIIRRDIEEAFRTQIGAKYAGSVPVEYCFQDGNDLPAPYAPPPGRVKPWGTAHALRAARAVVKEPFALINGDDFYGRDAFRRLAAFLTDEPDGGDALHFAMVGYRLDQTLSENGTVARGICTVDGDGLLKGVRERTKLARSGDAIENRDADGTVETFAPDTRVSMNCWGFRPGVFAELERLFPSWLAEHGNEEKSEWYVPFVVDDLIREGRADCRLLPTDASWFGVTYREDKPSVVEQIGRLVEAGEYPRRLF
jgi:NDP-sugar pyrophosphorylase family protein